MQFVDLTERRHPQGGHRTGARVGGPRKRRPAAVARGQRPQDHHGRPDQLRHHPEAAVHPQQGHPAGPGRPRADHTRPSTGTTARPKPSRWTRCSSSSPTRHRLHRDRGDRQRWPRPTTRDAPVVKLVNLIIQEAVNLRATDIHIEPFADRVRVRYRIDGVLVERDAAPRRLLAPLLSRIKIMGTSTSPRSAGPRTAGSR